MKNSNINQFILERKKDIKNYLINSFQIILHSIQNVFTFSTTVKLQATTSPFRTNSWNIAWSNFDLNIKIRNMHVYYIKLKFIHVNIGEQWMQHGKPKREKRKVPLLANTQWTAPVKRIKRTKFFEAKYKVRE